VQFISRRGPARGAALRVGAGMGKEMAVAARARSAPGALRRATGQIHCDEELAEN
jgi:hypothetical protein